LPGSDDGYLQ
ncbi:solute symporter family protein, partial [Vibrio parahaemolyticus 10296]